MFGIAETVEWLTGVENIQDIKQGYAVILSSIVVVIGWYFTRYGQIKSDRVKNTASFPTLFRDDKIRQQLTHVKDIINKKIVFDASNDKKHKAMGLILRHLEYTAASIRVGLISESFIDKIERSLIHTVFRSCSKYIHELRISRDSKTIYENLEILYIRSFVGKGSPFIYCIEKLTGYPRFRLAHLDFKIRWSIAIKIYGGEKDYMLQDWFLIKKKLAALRRLELITYFLIATTVGIIVLHRRGIATF